MTTKRTMRAGWFLLVLAGAAALTTASPSAAWEAPGQGGTCANGGLTNRR